MCQEEKSDPGAHIIAGMNKKVPTVRSDLDLTLSCPAY